MAQKIREIHWTDDDRLKMEQLQQLGESVKPRLGEHSGPIGARNIALGVLRSDRAVELAPLLQWLLMRKLGNHIHEQDDIVPCAVLVPGLGPALKPILPELLEDFVFDGDTAHCFLSTAHCIARSGDRDYIAMALPHFPEALRRVSWATQNLGNLACSYLDMGGNPEVLVEPLAAVINSQQDDAEERFCAQKKEVKRAKHLCSGGFIRLLNHPRVKESKNLTCRLQSYAGDIIWDDRSEGPIFRTDIYVLACVQDGQAGLAWAPSDEYARYLPIDAIDRLKGEFLKRSYPADIAEIGIRLFGTMETIPRRDISTIAHRAVKALKGKFSQDIQSLAARRKEWNARNALIPAGN